MGQNSGPGLSSSRFENMRRRALDAGRQQMMEQIMKQAQQPAQRAPGTATAQSQQLFPKFEDLPQPQASAVSFTSLGALPVPKFLQERGTYQAHLSGQPGSRPPFQAPAGDGGQRLEQDEGSDQRSFDGEIESLFQGHSFGRSQFSDPRPK